MGASAMTMIAVCGIKNSGKTTLIESLVSCLKARGKRVAVIKHDGHDFSCDLPGTDSARFSEAGAYGVAVFSAERIFVHKAGCGEDEHVLSALFPEADIILIEGLKDSEYPKIEVIRSGVSSVPASNPKGRFLIVTDHPAGSFDEECKGFEDIEDIADIVLRVKGTDA